MIIVALPGISGKRSASTRDCDQKGHVWVEPNPASPGDFWVFSRVRDLADVTKRPVVCSHCYKSETMVGWGQRR